MLSSSQLVKSSDITMLWKFCIYVMTVLEYIILLFKGPGVPEKKMRKKKLLNSPTTVTKSFTFKMEQTLNDKE